MNIVFTDSHAYEKMAFDSANEKFHFAIDYLDFRLTAKTALAIPNADVICVFVGDVLDAECLKILKTKGVKLLALRSAGFNHVDLKACKDLGILVCRVPNYSPYAVAEFAVGLILSLNRKIHRAYGRVRDFNFSVEGLVGFDLHGKTVGVIGAGKIGKIFANIMTAFGCKVLVSDPNIDEQLRKNNLVTYTSVDEIVKTADIISLHVPLIKETRHIIDAAMIAKMKNGVMLVNTGRGALIDAKALISGLKSGKIGGAGLDVYEEEEGVFFHDFSSSVLGDDVLARLITFPNVLMTSHQAFLTKEALEHIAQTTLENIKMFRTNGSVATSDALSI